MFSVGSGLVGPDEDPRVRECIRRGSLLSGQSMHSQRASTLSTVLLTLVVADEYAQPKPAPSGVDFPFTKALLLRAITHGAIASSDAQTALAELEGRCGG